MELVVPSTPVESECKDSSASERPAPEAPASAVTSEAPAAEVAPARKPRIWAVGGGKGGVGKTLISASYAMSLARKGRDVIAVDLDLGGANLHTCLGLDPPGLGIGDWAAGRVTDLPSLLVATAEPRLKMISGSQDPLKIVAMIEGRRDELVDALRKLDADDIIIDLGAGTHDMTIDFFNVADSGILSILPEPTSVENAYRFIRAVLYRRLRHAEVPEGIREVVEAAMDQKNILGIRSPSDLLAIIERLDPAACQTLREIIASFKPNIVINQVRSQVDIDVGKAICSVCRRYFGVSVQYAGYLDYDNAVWKAVRNKKSILREYPLSVLANRIERLTRTLLGEEKSLFP